MGTSLYEQFQRDQSGPKKPAGSLYDQFRSEQQPAAGHDIHSEYRSGHLAQRMARENQNDADALAADDSSPSKLDAFGRSLAATGANIAQGIPGMEAAEAGARALVRRQPYTEALSDIRGETHKIPTALRVGEKIAGGAPLVGVLPGSAAASGAVVGGADQLLSADPMSKTARGVRTAAGAAGGAAIGALGDAAVTAGRALLPARLGGAVNPASLLLRKQSERAASAKQLYDAALQEGRNNPMTPEIQKFLGEPDIHEIVTELQSTRPFQGVASDGPEMLDAVYKTLSDRAGVVKKGLQAVTPNRPNIGRFKGQDIKAAQNQGLDAMSGTPGHSPMPSYGKAVDDYAQRSREIEAVQGGYDAYRGAISSNLPTAKNLTRKTPEAFADWAAKATPAQLAAARQGILGGAKMAIRPAMNPLKPIGRALDASALLRSAVTPEQQWIEAMQNLGILSAGNATTP